MEFHWSEDEKCLAKPDSQDQDETRSTVLYRNLIELFYIFIGPTARLTALSNRIRMCVNSRADSILHKIVIVLQFVFFLHSARHISRDFLERIERLWEPLLISFRSFTSPQQAKGIKLRIYVNGLLADICDKEKLIGRPASTYQLMHLCNINSRRSSRATSLNSLFASIHRSVRLQYIMHAVVNEHFPMKTVFHPAWKISIVHRR